MRRCFVLFTLVPAIVATMTSTAHAQLPGEAPANTFELDGKRVRSVVVVGNNVWIAGVFTQVMTGNGDVVAGVQNLAVLNRTTGQIPAGVSPMKLAGVSGAQVWKLSAVGGTVYAAGKFKRKAGGKTYSNLLAFNGTTGKLIKGFRPTGVKAPTAVAAGGGRVYAGGKQLAAYDASTGAKLSGFATSSVSIDPSLRGHNTAARHRDLRLIDGFLYSACQCDSLKQGSTRQTKALVRFNPSTGAHDQSFTPQGAGKAAFGIEIATDGDDLYLAAGGSDFVARYAPSGNQAWKRDTSGSAQAVAISGDDLIVGGHFLEIGDQGGDRCGFKSSNPGTLDPNDQCATRHRLAAYSLNGSLRSWDPSVNGRYNGVWAIALESGRVHIGGEFRRVHGARQYNYGRLD
jgi:outer membrane protein assembly factor BamB